MAIWIEIHCDVRSQGPEDRARIDPWCLTDRNDNVMGAAHGGRKEMMLTLHQLEKQAKEEGWRKGKIGNWTCPNCMKMFRAGTPTE